MTSLDRIFIRVYLCNPWSNPSEFPNNMSHYTSTVRWKRGAQSFLDNRYSRGHVWRFDGGTEVPASSSPSVVPLPMSRADAVDPEEAFVASLSSCHMLWFLSLAAKRNLRWIPTRTRLRVSWGRTRRAKPP